MDLDREVLERNERISRALNKDIPANSLSKEEQSLRSLHEKNKVPRMSGTLYAIGLVVGFILVGTGHVVAGAICAVVPFIIGLAVAGL